MSCVFTLGAVNAILYILWFSLKGTISMGLPAKLVRSQLNFFKPFVANCSLETTRRGQDKLGELMEAIHRRDVIVRDHDFGPFQGAWIMPKDERRQGVVLYLHGGGYTCGNLDYAKGFAATLADECGVRVFCAAYRLAPEDRFPGRAGRCARQLSVSALEGVSGQPDPAVRRVCGRRADLLPVPAAQAAEAAAAMRADRHLAVDRSDRLRPVAISTTATSTPP